MKKLFPLSIIIVIIAAGFFTYKFSLKYLYESQMLKKVISRLEADSRIAEVIVSDIKKDNISGKTLTTIKFLEYNAKGQSLEPKFFTFSGNIIQFQSLVIRFDDIHIQNADSFKGKSAYIFWKVFMLDGENTREYEISPVYEIPQGYKMDMVSSKFEQELWKKFWIYALDKRNASKFGIKNAQIEAPGTRFIPGLLYTLKIEHDGGIRIDSSVIPKILNPDFTSDST